MANPGLKTGAAAPILNVDPAAREARVAAGSAQIMDPDGAVEITRLLYDYFVPDDADSVYLGRVRFLQFQRGTQIMDAFLLRSDLLQRKAESKTRIGR